MRALQYGRLVQATRLKLVSQASAAFACIWLFQDVVSLTTMLAWAVILAVVLAFSAKSDLVMHDPDHRLMNRGEFRRQIACAAVTGLVWVAPIAFFCAACAGVCAA